MTLRWTYGEERTLVSALATVYIDYSYSHVIICQLDMHEQVLDIDYSAATTAVVVLETFFVYL